MVMLTAKLKQWVGPLVYTQRRDLSSDRDTAVADRYSPRLKRLLLLTPSGGKETHIDSGSAIVAEDLEGPGLTAYYEGGRYSSMDWSEKLTHAAGRLVERYPTEIGRANV